MRAAEEARTEPLVKRFGTRVLSEVMIRKAPVLAFLFASTLSSSAFAQSDDAKSTARALGAEGHEALAAKDYAKSEDRFHRAIAIFDDAKAPVPPTLLLGAARASAGLGHLVASQEAYNRILRQGVQPGAPAVFVKSYEEASKEIEPVAARIAWVTINVSGCSNPTVSVDGVPISNAAIGVRKPTDPGKHVVKATAQGCLAGETTFTVSEAQSTEATIKLEAEKSSEPLPTPTVVAPPPTVQPVAAPAAPPGESTVEHSFPHKPVAIVSFSVAGVGLITGAVAGIAAINKHSDLSGPCSSGTCPADQADNLASYHTMGTVSTVGFVVAGVGAAAGIVSLVMAPKSNPASTGWIRPVIGPMSVGAVGQF